MNLNVSMVEKDLNIFLTEKEQKSEDTSGKALYDFLVLCVEKYSKAANDFIGYGGFNGDIAGDSLYYSRVKELNKDN